MPQGFVENGESLEEAAVRELREETGLTVVASKLQLLAITDLPAIGRIAISFRVEFCEEPQIDPSAESFSVAFHPLNAIYIGTLAWSEAMGDRPQKILGDLRRREIPIYLHCATVSREFTWSEYNVSSISKS